MLSACSWFSWRWGLAFCTISPCPRATSKGSDLYSMCSLLCLWADVYRNSGKAIQGKSQVDYHCKWKHLDVEKREPSYTVNGDVNWCSHSGKEYRRLSKNGNRTTIWPSNPTPGYISERNKNSNLKRYMQSGVHGNIIYSSQDMKQPKWPSADEWIRKMWYIHTVEWNSTRVRAQLCSTLWDPMDYSPPGSSVHGILQERILEWVALPSSRGSSWPRDRTHVCCISCSGGQILYHCTTWKILMEKYSVTKMNDVFPFAATWIDLERIMLSEISQRKTNTVCCCLVAKPCLTLLQPHGL